MFLSKSRLGDVGNRDIVLLVLPTNVVDSRWETIFCALRTPYVVSCLFISALRKTWVPIVVAPSGRCSHISLGVGVDLVLLPCSTYLQYTPTQDAQ